MIEFLGEIVPYEYVSPKEIVRKKQLCSLSSHVYHPLHTCMTKYSSIFPLFRLCEWNEMCNFVL